MPKGTYRNKEISLSDKEVGELRQLARSGVRNIDLARQFGIPACSAHAISSGRIRKHPRKTLEERFLAKVQKTDSCWLWTASIRNYGYGQIGNRPGPPIPAHRVSYELYKGPIPAGIFVLHCCDNPPCVNPDHLFLGTQKDNIRDAAEKGRTARGERKKNAKLTRQGVSEMRAARLNGASLKSLAIRYGVCFQTCSDVCRGKTWKF